MGDNSTISYGELLKVLRETVAKVKDKADNISNNFVPRECIRPHTKEEQKEPIVNVFDAIKNEIIELKEIDAILDEIINVI